MDNKTLATIKDALSKALPGHSIAQAGDTLVVTSPGGDVFEIKPPPPEPALDALPLNGAPVVPPDETKHEPEVALGVPSTRSW